MIKCDNLIKEFGTPPQQILKGISLEINDGEFVSITGKSGSGKSTLLYIISSLDLPSSGSVFLDGEKTQNMSVERIHSFRNSHVGFIFQFHYLLPELSSLENILLAPRKLGIQKKFIPKANELLETMGIEYVAHKLPSQMSGGEQQRVAIARALIMNPRYIFADEPTGNLDSVSGNIVMDILKKTNKENGTTICMVTHDQEFASMANREIYLIDGQVARS
ncbi:MAG: ABC transporter ATP-binding protein [Halobacteriovoraceae bacterium]|nr:ABC transporter ATP-binding protein [Halobacteriovoraceae bacterium]